MCVYIYIYIYICDIVVYYIMLYHSNYISYCRSERFVPGDSAAAAAAVAVVGAASKLTKHNKSRQTSAAAHCPQQLRSLRNDRVANTTHSKLERRDHKVVPPCVCPGWTGVRPKRHQCPSSTTVHQWQDQQRQQRGRCGTVVRLETRIWESVS